MFYFLQGEPGRKIRLERKLFFINNSSSLERVEWVKLLTIF